MLSQQLVDQFNHRGFIKRERLLDDATVETLREELKRVIENREGDGRQPVRIVNLTKEDRTPIWQIVNIWQASQPFRELMNHPLILEEIAQLTLARELRIWHDQIQYKPAEHGGVNMWHQDNPLWPIIDPPTQVTAWIALDDVDESNGCMSMVPGSHRWGDHVQYLRSLPSFDGLPENWNGAPVEVIKCPVAKGEVHYHHCLTWHGSHGNSSGRPRRAIAFHYMTEETYYIASGSHVMKPFVTASDGAKLEGEVFPLLWRKSVTV